MYNKDVYFILAEIKNIYYYVIKNYIIIKKSWGGLKDIYYNQYLGLY